MDAEIPTASFKVNQDAPPVFPISSRAHQGTLPHRPHHPLSRYSSKTNGGSICRTEFFQLERYYGWYSTNMRGQRLKRADAEVADAPEGDVIDLSAFKPRRIPSKKWRALIKKVWETGVRVDAARDPPEPSEPVIEPCLDDRFPRLRQRTGVRGQLKTLAALRCVLAACIFSPPLAEPQNGGLLTLKARSGSV
jgi:hypothetical protein